MSYKIKLDPLAKLDINDNIDWYEQQQSGLGSRFYEHVKNTFRLIEQNPSSFPKKYKNTRAVTVKTFPFTIHYLIDKKKKPSLFFPYLKHRKPPINGRKELNVKFRLYSLSLLIP